MRYFSTHEVEPGGVNLEILAFTAFSARPRETSRVSVRSPFVCGSKKKKNEIFRQKKIENA